MTAGLSQGQNSTLQLELFDLAAGGAQLSRLHQDGLSAAHRTVQARVFRALQQLAGADQEPLAFALDVERIGMLPGHGAHHRCLAGAYAWPSDLAAWLLVPWAQSQLLSQRWLHKPVFSQLLPGPRRRK